MTAREDAEIATNYSVKNIMFDDLNGNGMLDGNEIAPENELTIYSTIYSNFTDKNLSEEQIKEKVAQYESLEYKQLEGTMTCDELLDQLNQP